MEAVFFLSLSSAAADGAAPHHTVVYCSANYRCSAAPRLVAGSHWLQFRSASKTSAGCSGGCDSSAPTVAAARGSSAAFKHPPAGVSTGSRLQGFNSMKDVRVHRRAAGIVALAVERGGIES